MPTALFVPQVHPGAEEILHGEELLHIEEVGVAQRLAQQPVTRSCDKDKNPNHRSQPPELAGAGAEPRDRGKGPGLGSTHRDRGTGRLRPGLGPAPGPGGCCRAGGRLRGEKDSGRTAGHGSV